MTKEKFMFHTNILLLYYWYNLQFVCFSELNDWRVWVTSTFVGNEISSTNFLFVLLWHWWVFSKYCTICCSSLIGYFVLGLPLEIGHQGFPCFAMKMQTNYVLFVLSPNLPFDSSKMHICVFFSLASFHINIYFHLKNVHHNFKRDVCQFKRLICGSCERAFPLTRFHIVLCMQLKSNHINSISHAYYYTSFNISSL